MAKLPQKADVDDDLAEADIVLPQRSVPELMAELERSNQNELERLAEKLESDPALAVFASARCACRAGEAKQ
jgi:hypothetical protein